MMKRYFKIAMFCLTLVLVGCSSPAEYVNVIPKTAVAVAAVDCETLAQKSSLLSQNSGKSSVQKSLLDELSVGQADLLEKILADPSEAGIDWKQKMYVFVMPDTHTLAVALSVLDSEKLNFTLEVMGRKKFRGKVQEENGCRWLTSKELCVAFNEKVCVIAQAGPTEKINHLKASVASWIVQPADESFAASEYHKQLMDLDGDVRVFADMHMVPENASMISSMIYTDEMEDDGLAYFIDLSFKPGEVVGEGYVYIEDKSLSGWLKEHESVLKKLNGKSLKKFPKKTPLWFAVGLEGDELFDHLLDHPVYGKELENMRLPFNLENVLRSVDGDVALGFPYGLFIDVTNKELLKILVGTAKTIGGLIGVSVTEIGEDEFAVDLQRKEMLKWKDMEFQPCIGMEGNHFYLTANSPVTNELEEDASLYASPWAKEVDDNLLFGAFSFDWGEEILKDYTRSRKGSRLMHQYFDYVTYGQENLLDNKIVLSFKDKERNSLEQLVEMMMSKN